MRLDSSPDGPFKGDIFRSRRRKVAEEIELLRELRDKAEPEKGDLAALIIAGLTTIVPVALLVLFLYYAISMWVFG
jgi:hypothetical protein